MIRKALQRTFYGILVVWGVVTIVFFLFNILPGDPARMLLGQRSDLRSVEMVRAELGLDRPLYLQYLRYLNDLSPLSLYNTADTDSYFYYSSEKYGGWRIPVKVRSWTPFLKAPYLGISYQNRRTVGSMIAGALPNTFILALLSIVLASLVGTLLGFRCALRKDSFFDRSAIFLSTLGMSLPSFFAAILIGWIFAYLLSDITHLNLTGNLIEPDDFGDGNRVHPENIILPAITLAIRPLSVIVQIARSTLLDALNQDYVRTARAKGLPYKKVVRKHAVRNSLNPLITAISGWFASLMAGVVFVEYIFGWKGLGYMIVNGLNQYDMPVVLGSVITIAVIFVVINILVDFAYALLDPRVRTGQ